MWWWLGWGLHGGGGGSFFGCGGVEGVGFGDLKFRPGHNLECCLWFVISNGVFVE